MYFFGKTPLLKTPPPTTANQTRKDERWQSQLASLRFWPRLLLARGMKLVHSDSSIFVLLLTKSETWAGVPWQTASSSFLRHWCHQLWRSTESKPPGPGATDVATSSPSVSGVVSSPTDCERWVNLCRLLRHWLVLLVPPFPPAIIWLQPLSSIVRHLPTWLLGCLRGELCSNFTQKTWRKVLSRHTKQQHLIIKCEHRKLYSRIGTFQMHLVQDGKLAGNNNNFRPNVY